MTEGRPGDDVVAGHDQRRWIRVVGPYLPWGLPTALLAWVATGAILAETGGAPAVPLDDAFIHFEFARSFAHLRPFEYGVDGQPTPGATSLLWPLVLAPLHWMGLGGLRIIWGAWFLGWVSLALLGRETWLMGRGLLSREAATGAAAMVFAFGGYVWFAGSGMEVVPLAWLLMCSARKCAEWREQAAPSPGFRARGELLTLAWVLPAARPEGALMSSLIAASLLLSPRGRGRAWAWLALGGPLGPPLVNYCFTGHWTTTTTYVKWLPYSPYSAHVWGTIRYYVELLWSTLLDGRVWSALFVPQGSRFIAWAALPALVMVGWRTGRRWRAACVMLVGLGILLPTTYDSFLVNRLRYLWPFAAAWFVASGALVDEVGGWLARWCLPMRRTRGLMAGGLVGALASHWSASIDDLAVSASAIHQQQVGLALWAREHLPKDATVGLNDAGAIAYLSGRPTFDIVGLTTQTEGVYWASGPGSRYEHYERLGRERLPTHFIVYRRWMAIPALLGERMAERSVAGATILGDTTMEACVARYDVLGRAELPLGPEASSSVVDRLDVADLESEAEHDYQLLLATQVQNLAVQDYSGHVDGGRAERSQDRFALELRPGARLVARLASQSSLSLTVEVNGKPMGQIELEGSYPWEERVLSLPKTLDAGRQQVSVIAQTGATFTALHYWCVERQAAPRTIRKLMAPDGCTISDGKAGLQRCRDLGQSAPNAPGTVPVHHRDDGVRDQRANGTKD
ncbi:hypothetical protein ACFL5O_09125 [Myxococcota bacterium]